MLEQVVVWLDSLAPSQGAFAYAVEWAGRLRLPLHGVALASQQCSGSILDSCAETCDRYGISWQASAWDDNRTSRFSESLGAGRLDVVGKPLAPDARRRSVWSPPLATLVAPDQWRPLRRVLLLHRTRNPSNTFLPRAAHLCRALRAVPVVLTVARSEREAQRRQQFAEETLATCDLATKFDFIVGNDFPAAVTLDARWRNCTQVWLEQPDNSPWRRWLGGDPLKDVLRLANSLPCVAFSRAAEGVLPERTDRPPEPAWVPARTAALAPRA